MSLFEFDLYVHGYMKRIESQQELLAWHAANIMNCWTKKKVTAEKLMGKGGDAAPQTLEELTLVMRQQRDKVERDLARELAPSDSEIDFGSDAIEVDLSFAEDEPGGTLAEEDG